MAADARMLPGGRLHLQHGPIDLVIGADGAGRQAALRAASVRFETVLEELVAELPLLRQPTDARPAGAVARRMWEATRAHLPDFVNPMAAVAGAVSDEVLAAMGQGLLTRAYVNNGGDVAVWLAPGSDYTAAVAGPLPGRVALDGPGGIATSGRGGRSLSFGIADAVTVLAGSAAQADAAATLIANRVDLPGHSGIRRAPACEVQDDSDLGDRPVVLGVGPLTAGEVAQALEVGARHAQYLLRRGLIRGAMLQLAGDCRIVGHAKMKIGETENA